MFHWSMHDVHGPCAVGTTRRPTVRGSAKHCCALLRIGGCSHAMRSGARRHARCAQGVRRLARKRTHAHTHRCHCSVGCNPVSVEMWQGVSPILEQMWQD